MLYINNINLTLKGGLEINSQEFKERMEAMLPEAMPDAVKEFIEYAEYLERSGIHPAHQFYDEAYVEFNLVKQYDGQSIASSLLNLAKTDSFTLNPFEIRDAANHLKAGVRLKDIKNLAADFDRSLKEWQQSDTAMLALKNECRPSVLQTMEELANNTHKPQISHKNREKTDPNR